MNDKKFIIDEITWNDLSMDSIYELFCRSESSVGKDYSLEALKSLYFDEDFLRVRDKKTECISGNPDLKKSFVKIFSNLGVTKKYRFIDYIYKLDEVPEEGNLFHILFGIILLAAIAALFISPVIGIIGIVVMFAVNISTYFSRKGKVEKYFVCIKYLAGMVIAASKILKLDLAGTPFEEDRNKLSNLSETFKSIKNGSWLITNSVSGSLVDVIMDYVRMLFHVDLIKFNNMLKTAKEHKSEINELYTILGETELAISTAEFRESLDRYAKPEFSPETPVFDGMIHLLVKKPVANSLHMSDKKAVLLTGSNASGKSTFLKSVAINQILAQTVYTCTAKEFKTCFSKVISSMALSDNIFKEESYFVVEIKSLKRIFDELGEVPVMCLVDEVLRGTNTKERIAAATVILKKLSAENTVLLAATHDIELTQLLSEYMDNYHFSETVEGDKVTFDYQIKKGPSTTRNAIKLLKAYGFTDDVTSEAETLASGI